MRSWPFARATIRSFRMTIDALADDAAADADADGALANAMALLAEEDVADEMEARPVEMTWRIRISPLNHSEVTVPLEDL